MVYLPDLPKPPLGIEPRTYCLRNSCSTTKLRRQVRRAGETITLATELLWPALLQNISLAPHFSERVKGIEPSSQPWEGCIMPLYYTRKNLHPVKWLRSKFNGVHQNFNFSAPFCSKLLTGAKNFSKNFFFSFISSLSVSSLTKAITPSPGFFKFNFSLAISSKYSSDF